MKRLSLTARAAALGTIAVAACAMAATVAWATGTLDQSNPGPSNSATGECGASEEVAQTFTAGLTGSLDTVELALFRHGTIGNVVVSIVGTGDLLHPGEPDVSDILASQTISQDAIQDPVVFDTPASVTAGTKYAIWVTTPDCVSNGGDNELLWWETVSNQYENGVLCFRTFNWDCTGGNAGYDFVFATYVTVPPPPPSADVAVSISGPTSAKKGALAGYIVTVSNTGDTAHNVVLGVPVPVGASFQGVTTTKGNCTPPARKNPTISCALGDIAGASNAHITVTLKMTAKAGSSIADVVTANSTADGAGPATPDPNTSNNSAALSTTITK